MRLMLAALFVSLYAGIACHSLALAAIDDPVPALRDPVVCGVDEIRLASDGTIDRQSLQLGERVAPNHTLSGIVNEDGYHFYHLCIVRHEHEHQINVNLTMTSTHSADKFNYDDANLYISSEETHPRMGHSTWIAQHPGSDFLKLYTYLDGFPRKSDSHNRTIPLHIGVFGVSSSASYNLTVSVLDLPTSPDITSREQFYTKQHQLDRARRGGGAAAAVVVAQQSRRLRFES